MRVEKANLYNLDEQLLFIGYAGEKNHVSVVINCYEFLSVYTEVSVSMIVKPPHGDAYEVIPEIENTTVVWDITERDTAYSGGGDFQLTFVQNEEEVIKTAIGHFFVKPSLMLNATGQ